VGQSTDRRAAIYARVSTEEQGNKYSIDSQLDFCREYAQVHDLTVVSEYREIGESGTKKHRPQLDAMIATAHAGSFGTVLVWALDRLARGGAPYYSINEELTTAGCTLVFVKGGDEQKYAGLLAWLGEQEVQAFKERATAGRQRKAREGKINPPPWSRFGYDYDALTQRFVVNENEAVWVRQMFAWHLEGIGIRIIARRLQEAGVPTRLDRWLRERLMHLEEQEWVEEHKITDVEGERNALLDRLSRHYGWQEGAVSKMLKATEYYGEGYASKSIQGTRGKRLQKSPQEWIPFSYPAIISKETYEAAQEVTQRLRRVRMRPGPTPPTMLTGILWCSECQKWFQVHSKQDSKRLKDGTLRYYKDKIRL
jgi:site-specific DNA recombinase